MKNERDLTPEEEARVYVITVLRRFLREYYENYITLEEVIRSANQVTGINNLSDETRDKVLATFLRAVLKIFPEKRSPGRPKRSPYKAQMCFELVQAVRSEARKNNKPVPSVNKGSKRETAFQLVSKILNEAKIPMNEDVIEDAYEQHKKIKTKLVQSTIPKNSIF